MEFLAFDKMDREMDEILTIYMDLGGEKFDTNFRNTRKDIRTLCSEFKDVYQNIGKEQMEREKKLESQKETMEYKTLDFRIKTGIVRLGLNLVDIEKEITRYCKQNNIHNERFFNKFEADAKKEARGGNVSDITQSFGTNTNDDGFDDEDFEDVYNDLNASSFDKSQMTHSEVANRSSMQSHSRALSQGGSSRNIRKKSDSVDLARPKVNKDLLNEEELLVQEMVESVENFEACLGILIKREVFYQLNNERQDEWYTKIPDRFKRKVRHYRDLLKNEVIPEEDEEYEDSEEEPAPKIPEFELDGVDEQIAETKEEPAPPSLKMPKFKKEKPKTKKTFKLTAEEEMALDMFDELDAKMDDNLKLVSKELDLLGEKLDVAEEDLDKNAEMINEIDDATKQILTDVRDQNKQMKEQIAKFREPGKLVCDIILILVLCLFIGVFVFLLKRYFEIKRMIEEIKSNNVIGKTKESRLLII
jgi:hypothetical protein